MDDLEKQQLQLSPWSLPPTPPDSKNNDNKETQINGSHITTDSSSKFIRFPFTYSHFLNSRFYQSIICHFKL